MKYRVLTVGDPAPWVSFPTPSTALARIDLLAGRYIVLCFLGSSTSPDALATLGALHRRRALFDDVKASFFGVTCDPADVARLKDSLPGIRFGLDITREAGVHFGAVSPEDNGANGKVIIRPLWFVLDPTLRVIRVEPFGSDPVQAANSVLDYLQALPPPRLHAGFPVEAPVLVLPNVFEPQFCQKLTNYFETHRASPSGFMDEVEGKTILREDPAFKSRSDVSIADEALRAEAQRRVQRRVVPEIWKVHQFEVTRMERYLIACYRADERGRFIAHRDNSTKGTQHRRFAVSIMLNDGFEGGELHFPEYGSRPFDVPAGCAVVFSCSLMHEVKPLTKGNRYAFLPFLYDESAAALRESNNAFLGDGMKKYDPDRE